MKKREPIKSYILFIFCTTMFTYFNIYYGDNWNRNVFYGLYSLLIMVIFYKNKITKSILNRSIIHSFFLLFLPQYAITYLISFLSIRIEKRKLIKVILIINVFFYLLTITLYKKGYLVPKRAISFRELGGEIIVRNTLGFNNANQPMIFLFIIISSIIYLYYENNKLFVNIIIFLMSTYIYSQTNSRTVYYTILIILILLNINNKIIGCIKKIKGLFILFFPSLTYLISVPYYNKSLDHLLSNRLYIYNTFLTNRIGKVLLFGNGELKSFYPLDNAYINILYKNGIVGLIIYIYILFYILKILLKYKDYIALKLFIGTLFFGFMEKDILYYYFSIIIYIIPSYLEKEKSRVKIV